MAERNVLKPTVEDIKKLSPEKKTELWLLQESNTETKDHHDKIIKAASEQKQRDVCIIASILILSKSLLYLP